jgi:hypothetical protein
MQNEWVVDSGCTHHMAKDASLFTSLDKVVEWKIYVVDEFSLDIVGHGDVPCRHGKIVDVYHVPNLSTNLLFGLSADTDREDCGVLAIDRFLVKDLKNGKLIIVEGFLDSKDDLYKFCDLPRQDPEPDCSCCSH